MIERLKPCPNERCAHNLPLQVFSGSVNCVKCLDCGTQGPGMPSEYAAIAAWNQLPRGPLPEETADTAERAPDGYETLRAEFAAATEQASGGKGKERHANNQPFEDQPILAITRLLEGHPCGALAFQVIKKTIEAGRLVKLRGTDAAVAEIYGAMNYAAAMAIRLKEIDKREKEDQ